MQWRNADHIEELAAWQNFSMEESFWLKLHTTTDTSFRIQIHLVAIWMKLWTRKQVIRAHHIFHSCGSLLRSDRIVRSKTLVENLSTTTRKRFRARNKVERENEAKLFPHTLSLHTFRFNNFPIHMKTNRMCFWLQIWKVSPPPSAWKEKLNSK